MKLSEKDWLQLYRNMVLTRELDEASIRAYHSGARRRGISPHTGIGQEAVSVGGCTFLRPDDYVVKTHRGWGADISRGTPMGRLLAGARGKATGLCKGKGGGHAAFMERGVVGIGGTIGSCFPLAAGLGFAAKQEGKGKVVACFFGDGAAQRATLHEAMNWVSVRKLPVLWICENNGYYVSIPVSQAIAAKDIVDLAGSYNMPGHIVDGQDVLAVAEAVHAAAERARQGEGPTLLDCKTYRFRGHEEVIGEGFWDTPDDPRGKEQAAWRERDPIKMFREYLLQHGVKEAMLDKIDQAAEKEVEEWMRFSEESPYPDPEAAFEDMYAE